MWEFTGFTAPNSGMASEHRGGSAEPTVSGDQPGQHAGDARPTGALRAEHLTEEGPKGQRRHVHRLATGGALLVERLLEAVGGQLVGKGKAVGLAERARRVSI
jgi:hypothetical protein